MYVSVIQTMTKNIGSAFIKLHHNPAPVIKTEEKKVDPISCLI